jgi:hypothetical protein
VEANYGDGNWYTATVAKKNADGTFQVKWDDAAGGPETADVAEADIKEYVPPIPIDQLVPGSKHKGKVVSVAFTVATANSTQAALLGCARSPRARSARKQAAHTSAPPG